MGLLIWYALCWLLLAVLVSWTAVRVMRKPEKPDYDLIRELEYDCGIVERPSDRVGQQMVAASTYFRRVRELPTYTNTFYAHDLLEVPGGVVCAPSCWCHVLSRGRCPCGYFTECAIHCGDGHRNGQCPPRM